VKEGIPVAISNPAHGGSFLVTAAVRNDKAMFDWLLSEGLSIDGLYKDHSKDNHIPPPLHNTAYMLELTYFIGAEEIISLFIENGVDLTIKDNDGNTAYELISSLVESSRSKFNVGFIEMLKL